jgi:hypothetical protein
MKLLSSDFTRTRSGARLLAAWAGAGCRRRKRCGGHHFLASMGFTTGV